MKDHTEHQIVFEVPENWQIRRSAKKGSYAELIGVLGFDWKSRPVLACPFLRLRVIGFVEQPTIRGIDSGTKNRCFIGDPCHTEAEGLYADTNDWRESTVTVTHVISSRGLVLYLFYGKVFRGDARASPFRKEHKRRQIVAIVDRPFQDYLLLTFATWTYIRTYVLLVASFSIDKPIRGTRNSHVSQLFDYPSPIPLS